MQPAVFYTLVTLNVIAMVLIVIAGYYSDGKFPRDPCEQSHMKPIYMEHWPPLLRPDGECEKTRYRILRYFEGEVTTDYQEPKGYPVLFVPGHLGSFKQARSLGSQVGENVTVYTIDFLEQPAGLSGNLLRRQAEFVNKAAHAISQLHQGKPVIIVGHSMGAVAAWGSQNVPNKRPVEVSTFFGICGPLLRPILLSEKVMADFYRDFERNRMNSSSNLVLVSLSCGRRDFLVPSHLCGADKLIKDEDLLFQAPVSELIGFSVHHASVLWCNQVSVRIATAVTRAAHLGSDPAKRRMEVANTLLGLPEGTQIEQSRMKQLREKVAISEDVGRALVKPGANLLDRILLAFVFTIRSRWTRLFAFCFASASLVFVLSMKDAYADVLRDAETFVDDYNKVPPVEKPLKGRWRLVEELRATSLYRQLKCVYNFSSPLLPLAISLFAYESIRDDGAWFANLWLLLASQGFLQLLFEVIVLLRRIGREISPRPTRKRVTILSAICFLGLGGGLFVVVGDFQTSLIPTDLPHLLLCCFYVSVFAYSIVLTLWVALTWGSSKNALQTKGFRAEVRAVMAIGLMHVLSICDSLGCFLLVWDALMLTAPWFEHQKDLDVIAPPMRPAPPCRLRLDAEETLAVYYNLVLMFPALCMLHSLVWLDLNSKFVHVKGDWGEFEFEKTSGAVAEIIPKQANGIRMPESSTGGARSRRSGIPNCVNPQSRTEVELVGPVELSNGRKEFIERITDDEYDENEPSQLLEVGQDVIQIDTLKPADENIKDPHAEVLHFGRDIQLQGHRRKWFRKYNAVVKHGRVLGMASYGLILPMLVGLFFLIQNQQLVLIFPAAALVNGGFVLGVYFSNQQERLIHVERIQRGG